MRRFNIALINLGKFSELNKAMIARAWDLVREEGILLVEGAKTDGVDSIIRSLKPHDLDLMPWAKHAATLVDLCPQSVHAGNHFIAIKKVYVL